MPYRFGVDIGALFLKVVRTDGSGNVVGSHYERHRGQPAAVLERSLAALGLDPDTPIGFTGSSAEPLARSLGVPYRDVTLCQISAIRELVPDACYIMDVGGASATLIQLDGHGRFQGYATNSLCAAGTGSFLDEQAGRLGISYSDARDFTRVAEPPNIATRCAVFAKSDLIHRQQEGYSREEMWSGLCRGMTRTLLATLLSGRPFDGRTVVIGGVALNREVLRWLEQRCPDQLVVPGDPHLVGALGASHHAELPTRTKLPSTRRGGRGRNLQRFPWRLELLKSKYPNFATEMSFEDHDGNEVRVSRWPRQSVVRAYLGIDIGSTSTKALLIDERGDVIADFYRKTAGDPIGATLLLFRAIAGLAHDRDSTLDIRGVGTTGSGRKIVGSVVGADAIINEISAHVAGAARVDPTIDTIFEVGGQDAKYVHLVDGNIRDANMNYVCAAGTGSFVEEQAIKLGYRVSEAGPRAMGIRPPRATDRCTVFMEQDMTKLIQAGASPQEAFAAVMVSVVKNYLNRVVGSRYRSRSRIFFQGATARNPALVAAFERLLDVEMVVSPYCHVMGAYGVALLTRKMMARPGHPATRFRGLDLNRHSITLSREICELCQNHCAITFANLEGRSERPSWGYMCGREPEDGKKRVNPHGRLLKKRQRLWLETGRGAEVSERAPVIGLPQALSLYSYLPLWRRFFNRLGFRVKLSGPTTQEIRELGGRLSGAEFCFPAKMFLGHAASLVTRDGVDFLFLPQMKSERQTEHVSGSTFCPYVQATPALTCAAFRLNGLDPGLILAPIVDLRRTELQQIEALSEALSGPLGVNRFKILTAWRAAIGAQHQFERKAHELGLAALAEARARGEKVLLLVGRPYNLYDPGLNLGLPEKLADYGRRVIPLDTIPTDLSRLGPRYRNMFWSYGQKIVAALEQAAEDDRLDVVYFSNFNCGPDSFLLSYASEILGAKPYLVLELDEHGSDTGYLTRIEAFLDVLSRPRHERRHRRRAPYRAPCSDLRDRIVWIPNMHPYSTEFVAAALRAEGHDARTLPLETPSSYELGRSVTRGSECLPMSLTIGSLLTMLRSAKPRTRHAFFMPSAQGPCRFGQYVSLHRQILDREGFTDVEIMSPSHYRGFAGLDEGVRRSLWRGLLVGDILMKAGCRIRPYEVEPGATDRLIATEMQTLSREIEARGDLERAVRLSIARLSHIPRRDEPRRPLVGVVGEIYVRNNLFANENVLQGVERTGGEAWMAPLAEWILFASSVRNVFDNIANRLSPRLFGTFVKWLWMVQWEKKLYAAASPLLEEREEPKLEDVVGAGQKYLSDNVGGEALLTLGRAVKFAHQGAVAVVNVAPFGCMPGTVTTALFRQVSADVGIPIVNLFYDGTGGQSRRLEVYLRNAMQAGAGTAPDASSAAGTRNGGGRVFIQGHEPVHDTTPGESERLVPSGASHTPALVGVVRERKDGIGQLAGVPRSNE